MSAITLNEAAKLAIDGGETHRAGVIAMYAEKSDLMAAMKFEGISGNALAFDQEGDLPTTAFRGVNEAYTPGSGTIAPQVEALMIAGGDLDVDNFIIKTQGQEVRSTHEAMKVKSLAATITDAMVKGDNTSNPRQFDGFQKRVTDVNQLIANGATSGGNALSLYNLDKAIDAVGGVTHLLMARQMRVRMQQAARSNSVANQVVTMDMDSDLGRRVTRYGEIPILVGYEPNKNVKLLPFSEANPGGGSAVGTSIYPLNLNEDGVVGISNGGIDVRDLGELQGQPVWRTRVEWYLSMAVKSQFAIARLWGITDAPIVA
jgi:hypothetical protein